MWLIHFQGPPPNYLGVFHTYCMVKLSIKKEFHAIIELHAFSHMVIKVGGPLMWSQHMFKYTYFKMASGKPRWCNLCLPMYPTSSSLVSRLVLLLLGINVCFQLWSKIAVLQGLLPLFHIRARNIQFKLEKEGPTLKPSSSELGTCEGRNSSTLSYQTLFQNQRFHMCVASPSKRLGVPI